MSALENIPEDFTAKFLSSSASEQLRTPVISLEDLESECQGNEILRELLESTLDACARYTETVAKFEQVRLAGQVTKENGELETIDEYRTRIHNSTIDSINILARNMKMSGVNGDWIAKITPGGRAGYGRFALAITFSRLARQLVH